MRAEPWAGSQETKAFTWSHGRVVGGGGSKFTQTAVMLQMFTNPFFKRWEKASPRASVPPSSGRAVPFAGGRGGGRAL